MKDWLTQEEVINLIIKDAGMELNRNLIHGEILRYLESYLGDTFYDYPEKFEISADLVEKLRNYFKKGGYDRFK